MLVVIGETNYGTFNITSNCVNESVRDMHSSDEKRELAERHGQILMFDRLPHATCIYVCIIKALYVHCTVHISYENHTPTPTHAYNSCNVMCNEKKKKRKICFVWYYGM